MTNSSNLYLEPWLISFGERKKRLLDSINEGKKIALYYSKAPDSSTFRYRCYNTFQATKNSSKWQAIYFYHSEFKKIKSLATKAAILVLGRQSRWDSSIKEFSDFAHNHKIPLFFDLDDLVFDKRYLRTVTNTISSLSSLSYWSPYFSDINKTAEQADGFIVTNDFIGEKLKDSFQKPYETIRNSLNDEQVAASRVYLEYKKSISKRDQFKIGYFGGSPTHANDLDVAMPELLYFLKKHPNSTFNIVGYMQFDDRFQNFLKNGQITFTPPVDFRKLQRLMSEVDVNLAPLVINDFTNCKSELKFFEAAIVETTTLASPTYCFKKAIKQGSTGFLCQPGEWLETIEYLYQNPKKNQTIAKAAKDYCLKEYYGKVFLKEVEEAYDRISQ